MKRILTLFLALAALCTAAQAQEYKDSLYRKAATTDSTLVGKDIFNLLQDGKGRAAVRIEQSSDIRSAFNAYVDANAKKKQTGYRIRVYFSNVQSARNESDRIAKTIVKAYPWVGVYRSFERPNFKVAVGDFRSKDDALRLFTELKRQYPEAILLEEKINYPVSDPAR